MSGYFSLADGRALPLHHGFVVGRTAGCDLVIDDSKASRRHLRVIVEAGVAEVEDLDSSNGTLLNGKPVTRRLLRDGDQVQIGKTVLVYREGAPPAPRGAASAPAPAGAAVFDDDDDLFGGDSGAKTAAPPPASTPPAPAPAAPRPAPAVPRAEVGPPAGARPPAAATPAAPPPPAPPPRPAVVEFADEVVEVRKAPPQSAASPAAAKSGSGAAGGPVGVQVQQRVLQFSKQSASGSPLGDDLGQLSSGARSLVFALVLVGAAGIAWLVVHLVR
ncbi:MAG: FHA domain-containing protein [Planctomycetes bacterium]|nr:FHA domain-containing protein [Planctomycetota bacterium]